MDLKSVKRLVKMAAKVAPMSAKQKAALETRLLANETHPPQGKVDLLRRADYTPREFNFILTLPGGAEAVARIAQEEGMTPADIQFIVNRWERIDAAEREFVSWAGENKGDRDDEDLRSSKRDIPHDPAPLPPDPWERLSEIFDRYEEHLALREYIRKHRERDASVKLEARRIADTERQRRYRARKKAGKPVRTLAMEVEARRRAVETRRKAPRRDSRYQTNSLVKAEHALRTFEGRLARLGPDAPYTEK